MSTSDPVMISSYARTPMGAFQGALSSVSATELGSAAVRAAIARAGVSGDRVDAIYMGCVLPAGLGQAPARQAALGAGLPLSVQATTVNKMCGSGMQAAIMAADALSAGSLDVALAGGMESMSNAPYLLTKHRGGARIGHDAVKDSMFLDGLEDAYTPGKLMGVFADETAREYQFTRDQQDTYALESLSRAVAAIESGAFAREIVAVNGGGKADAAVAVDEQPGKAKPEKIPSLKPAFVKDGTVTAANSSSISDGAACLLMTRRSHADRMGLPTVARLVAHAAHAHEPGLFTTAPVPAMRKVLEKAGWSVDDVDLWEINEAFAVVPMVAMRDLRIPREKLNVHGGACALGHPIGASGARIIATLLAALDRRGLKRGVASLCIGGGEATAIRRRTELRTTSMQMNGIATIVTGGASGLGAATATMFAQAGARVSIFDLDVERGEAKARELDCSFTKVDVTDDASVAAAVDTAEAAHGVARVLVNCAGIAPPSRTVNREGQPHSLALFRKVVEINLIGSFNVLSKVAARLVGAETIGEERGVIVNTASVAAYDGQIGQAAYSASKAAIVGMTLPVARDLAQSAIRVVTIAPGIFITPMLEGLPQNVQDSLGQQVPFPSRLGRPDEYAQLVAAIIANPMLNGETIRLDGAIRMGPK